MAPFISNLQFLGFPFGNYLCSIYKHLDWLLPKGREVGADLHFPCISPLLEPAEFSLFPRGARSGGEL